MHRKSQLVKSPIKLSFGVPSEQLDGTSRQLVKNMECSCDAHHSIILCIA